MTSSRVLRFFLPLPVLFATLAVAPAVWADVLPPQACDREGDSLDPSVVGQACDIAGEYADEPGVCVAATCGAGPARDGGLFADAGPSPGYSCYLCEVTDGGTPTTNPSAGSGRSSGGCSTSPFERDGSVGGGMLAVGLFAFAWGRRKKSTPAR